MNQTDPLATRNGSDTAVAVPRDRHQNSGHVQVCLAPSAFVTDEGDPPSPGPTIACSRCGREFTLEYELDELQVGNQAVEKFALDHKRHTGHFPDEISTWTADCRKCPETVHRLEESGATRWARTHARHTGHEITLRHAESETRVVD